jgi:superfamily II DNA or RNA helicase
MPYQVFEIPSTSDNHQVDIVLADPENPDSPAYSHYAYTIGATSNINELKQKRGIPFNSFRKWDDIFNKFPKLQQRLTESKEYYPGESVLEYDKPNTDFYRITVMRLGALELLANIFSGRITASEKDPFPHQLALQQYMKTYENRVHRLLIADEVGLGKTIEIGLLLRDKLIAGGSIDQFRCLYLTSGGLREDVCSKLRSVIQSGVNGQNIVQVEDSFKEYGMNNISGIHIGSMHAAKLYVRPGAKKNLPESLVNPEIVIIDECHHCASVGNLDSPEKIKVKNTTRAYEAAYQIITGTFWKKSEPPKLVVLMSATPFRSKPQFVNLLRLLTHQKLVENAYSEEIDEIKLVNKLKSENSSAAIIWRQQDDVRSWSNERLFSNLTIIRPHLEGTPRLADTNPEYLEILREIRNTVEKIHKNHTRSFGGFAIAQLEKRLTSSSLAGACWLFRWCVRHQKWKTQAIYHQDKSDGTERLRKLIREISQRLAAFDIKNKNAHADVLFPSDHFHFELQKIAQKGNIIEIHDFSRKLEKDNNDDDDDEDNFIATSDEIATLTKLALNLLNFTDANEGTGIENAKLNWLKDMLEQYPESRFLVFTESLQTCTIITGALPGRSDSITGDLNQSARDNVIKKFSNLNSQCRVLVVTSAADEGFDFQVANRVVHWDLNSSPAVLMQRNGRVARLGQVSDVTAYYLIMAGTHEEKRDNAMRDRFAELGITDEKLQLKILGSLSSEEEKQIETAVEEEQLQIIKEILDGAKKANDEMEKRLNTLQQKLEPQSVIDRKDLADRLKRWDEIGLPSQEQRTYKLTFDTVDWDRPVFRDVATIEKAEAQVATIQKKKVTFDPEFKIFGKDANHYSLAGLCPWTKKENQPGILEHLPLGDIDPIGNLARSLARQSKADFSIIPAVKLYDMLPELIGTRYLLFATHPMREAETDLSENIAPYLTFYAFGDNLQEPLNPKGSSATDVWRVISLMEKEVIITNMEPKQIALEPSVSVIEESRQAGINIAGWLQSSRKLPKLGQQAYFLPIPVALIAVL